MDASRSWTSQEASTGASEEVERVLSDFIYSPCFCEENVYLLCKKLSDAGLAAPDASDLFVVFISNPNRQVSFKAIPLGIKNDRFSTTKGVAGSILAAEKQQGCCRIEHLGLSCHMYSKGPEKEKAVQVWDLDTTLPCPTPFQDYVAETFQSWVPLRPEFTRLYRVVAALIFLKSFASDRRHMKNEDGSWMAEPPSYDCIVAEDGAVHNIEEFITVSVEHVISNASEAESLLMHEKFGIVLDEEGFKQFCK